MPKSTTNIKYRLFTYSIYVNSFVFLYVLKLYFLTSPFDEPKLISYYTFSFYVYFNR